MTGCRCARAHTPIGWSGPTLEIDNFDLDDLNLVAIHPLPSYVWYEDMADFTDWSATIARYQDGTAPNVRCRHPMARSWHAHLCRPQRVLDRVALFQSGRT